MTLPNPEEPTQSDPGPYVGQAPPSGSGAYPPPNAYPNAGHYGQIQPYGQASPYQQPPMAQPPYPPPTYGQPVQPPYAVAAKSPGLALLVSFFIPGVGSMMNGDVGKGVGILIGYVFSWFMTFLIIGIPGLLAFWIWGMADAYTGAQKWNMRHGIVS